MSSDAFAAVSRGAIEAVSRRNSFLTLGGAALAAGLARQMRAEAKPSAAKKAAKKAKKKCKRQGGQCAVFFVEFCEESECEEEALDRALRCCAGFKTCNAGALLDCLFTPTMM